MISSFSFWIREEDTLQMAMYFTKANFSYKKIASILFLKLLLYLLFFKMQDNPYAKKAHLGAYSGHLKSYFGMAYSGIL